MAKTPSALPAANASVLASGTGATPEVQKLVASAHFSTVWFQYFWNQWLGRFPLKCAPIDAPLDPTSGFVIYCDLADGKLKAKSSAGIITVLALP